MGDYLAANEAACHIQGMDASATAFQARNKKRISAAEYGRSPHRSTTSTVNQVDVVLLWGDRPYSAAEMRFLFLAWNAVALACHIHGMDAGATAFHARNKKSNSAAEYGRSPHRSTTSTVNQVELAARKAASHGSRVLVQISPASA